MQVDTHHECLVCGDRIELMYQVCSRFCMRALEQLEFMDLEAQVESPRHIQQTEGGKVAPVEEQSSLFLNPFTNTPLTEAKLE